MVIAYLYTYVGCRVDVDQPLGCRGSGWLGGGLVVLHAGMEPDRSEMRHFFGSNDLKRPQKFYRAHERLCMQATGMLAPHRVYPVPVRVHSEINQAPECILKTK